MPYLLTFLLICCIVAFVIYQNKQLKKFKRNGIKVMGCIIANDEYHSNDKQRLGGNINNPVIKFITKEGKEIVGKPISDFISQREITVPMNIVVIYDANNPERSYVNF